MSKKKALVTTSVASMVSQFILPSIIVLCDMDYEVTVGCNFEKGNNCDTHHIIELKRFLSEIGVQCMQVDFERNMFRIHNHFKAYWQIKNILKDQKFDLIHCHSPIGGFITRAALRKSENQKVIYTAHGFHFYKGAPGISWLVYYPIEKLCSKKTDVLITINMEDYEFAKSNLCSKKVKYVPGIGIDIKNTNFKLLQTETGNIRMNCGVGFEEKLLLSVGELNKNKNHVAVLKALFFFSRDYPDVRWRYVICGKGKLRDKLLEEARKYGIEDRVRLVGFSDEVKEYLSIADLFIHPSFREGLSVALMEAIAHNVKVICSDIRGNRDLVAESGRFDPRNTRQIENKIYEHLFLPSADEQKENMKRLRKCSRENVDKLLKEMYSDENKKEHIDNRHK